MRQALSLSVVFLLAGCFDLQSLQRGSSRGNPDASGAADAAGPDSGIGDLGQDLPVITSGCADGRGTNIGAGSPFAVWTCPGTFSASSGIYQRCAASFSVCRVIEIGAVACNGAQGGKFVGVKGYRQATPFPPDPGQASYTWDGGGTQNRGIMYCGSLGSGGYSAPAAAAGFFRVLECDSGGVVSSFACPVVSASDQDFANVSNTDPSNGVLCCPTSTQ